ncbi:uncharacterized protein A1O9_06415 [Exophiala aquamarina CBS 119918]|uniref:Zn(2)-C6 fungal-type domain-containing protein n=1 Tax=Exophiala aquamarina CBS 119918 TaxID=1182545 RepID=A0A072PEF9_9EURO|nr:uncharacterized protein A1O9_06415 [Exophiala aquamarina CBS 119918]KEF58489.1 hypothetical protein A1O9_06415 [Exophiala aquamarina CBS 119918]
MPAKTGEQDQSNTVATPSKGRAKPPSLLACIPCRKSHLKCDGKKPQCSRCSDRSGACFWVDSKRGYREFRKGYHSTSDVKSRNDANVSESKPGISLEEYNSNVDPTQVRQITYEEIFQSNDPAFTGLPLEFQPVQMITNLASGSPSSRSDSTLSITREINPIVQSEHKRPTDLIELFYKHLYPPHPFIIPWKFYLQNPSFLPTPLKSVLRFAASHYVPHGNPSLLQAAANEILSDDVPDDGFKVQGLILYAFVSHARMDEDSGATALMKAVGIALQIGMNRETFAIQHGQDNPILQECWRRTWWMLMILEGLVTVIGGQGTPYTTYATFTDVALPGHDEDYNELRVSSQPRTVADLRNRILLEDPFSYSSFAYGIEASYILGAVLSLGPDSFAVTDPQIEALDASISNYFLSLPLDKRDPTLPDGSVDESLLNAHLAINWAAIALHRPRSTLTFIRNHYRTTCTRAEAAGLPALAYSCHTAKALRAANAMISLASIQRPLSYCTPALMCGITTAATVHLPAYAIVDRPDQAIAIKERLQLGISALASFGEIWPRASIAKGQVARFAREILLKPNVLVDSTGPEQMPRLVEPTNFAQIQHDAPFNNDVWMENLLQAEEEDDPAMCPVFNTAYAVSNVHGS